MSTDRQWQDLGVALHTALRKICESRISGIAWNIVSASESTEFEDGAWDFYVKRLAPRLPNPSNLRALTEEIMDGAGPREPREMFLWNALRDAFVLFDERDWTGYGWYLPRGEET